MSPQPRAYQNDAGVSYLTQCHRNSIVVGAVGLTGEFIASYGGEVSKPASLDERLRRLDRGDFDRVGVGRALLQDRNGR